MIHLEIDQVSNTLLCNGNVVAVFAKSVTAVELDNISKHLYVGQTLQANLENDLEEAKDAAEFSTKYLVTLLEKMQRQCEEAK